MDSDLKSRREQFIHGHTGGSYVEVIALTGLLQLSHILFSSFLFACPALVNDKCPRIAKIRIFLDFCTNIVPFVFAITVLSDYVYHIFIAELVVIVINFQIYMTRHNLKFPTIQDAKSIAVQYPSQSSRLSYVSHLMSALLLATSIAILAVDFPLFDRRFAKTEMYGWSLMDVGVGGFIAINGALSPESRLVADSKISRLGLVLRSLKSASPLLLLGLIRFVSVKGLNYQEHVSEYGVHWNFFFTIAFSKFFSSILCSLLSTRVNFFLVSSVLALGHQYLFTFGGLTEFILNPSRSNIIEANKEGLISTVGSVCLFLFFVQYGRVFLPKRLKLHQFGPFMRNVFLIGTVATLLMFTFHHLVEPTSRRETNFAFICFMISFISALILIEIVYFVFLQALSRQFRFASRTNVLRVAAGSIDPLDHRYESALFESLGSTGLLMFLSANLLTGLVNFSIDTLSVTSVAGTLAILFVYCAALAMICRVLFVTLYSKQNNTDNK